MEFSSEGKKYEIFIATEDNGVSCELWDLDENRHLIDIFKNESLKKIEVYCAEMTIPFPVFVKVLEHFNAKIGPEFK